MQRGLRTISDKLNQFAMRWPGHAGVLLGAGFFVFLLLLTRREIELFDEGIILVGAQRVLAGEVLHRDFYSNYGPGSYHLLAGLFALFGEQALVARLFGLAWMAAPVGLVFALLARRVPPWLALAASAATGAAIYASPFYLYPVFPCLALLLASALVLAREGAWQRTWPLLAAGALTGVVALFRYDTGFFGLATLCLFAGVMAGRWQAAVRPVLLLGMGAGAAFAPFAAWFLAHAPVSAFWTDIVELSAPYAPYRGLPFPGPVDIAARPGQALIYLPFLAGLAGLAEWWRRRRGMDGLALLLTLLTLVMIYKGMVRTSVVHMLLAIVPGLALCAVLVERWWVLGKRWRMVGTALAGLALLVSALLAAQRLRADLGAFDRTLAGGLLTGAEPPLIGLIPPDYQRMSDYLARRVPAGERILVALDRHDKMFVNPLTLHFTSGHLPATRWAQFDPGVQTTAPVQRAMIAELEEGRVRFVVRDASFSAVHEPNLSAVSSGVVLLDRHLAAHFRRVAGSGMVEVWLRKGEEVPPEG